MAAASVIRVQTGDSLAGVDISVEPQQPVQLAVHFRRGDGGSVGEVTLNLSGDWARVPGQPAYHRVLSRDGAPVTLQIEPGRYVLTAYMRDAQSSGTWVGVISADVNADSRIVTLELEPAGSLSGAVSVEDGRGLALKPESLSVELTPKGSPVLQSMLSSRLRTSVGRDGIFRVDGVPQGEYALSVTFRSREDSNHWVVTNITIDGGSVVGPVFAVRPSQRVVNVALTVGRAAGLDGTLLGYNEPLAQYHLLVFPVERPVAGGWQRHIRIVRPTDTGECFLRGLRPGRYNVALLRHLDERLGDRTFLDQLETFALPITLRAGETIVPVFQIRGGEPVGSAKQLVHVHH
jgi:hypothetical protein